MANATTSWWARLRLLRRLRADPARIGDAAVLQSDLLGARMTDEVRARVETLCARSQVDRLRPRLDRDALARLPAGTFGRAYADFCAANAIVPAAVSDACDDAALRRSPAIARYVGTHDLFHVLLGCDTSVAEELRISAFILEQRYFRGGRLLLALLGALGPLLRPHEARRVRHNVRLGRALARRAPLLLAEPLEDLLELELAAVQRSLGLPATSG